MRETECTIILLSLMSCYLISISFFFCKPIPTSAEVKIHDKKMILSSSHIPHYPRSSYNITLSLLQIPYLIFLQQDTPYKRTPPPHPPPHSPQVSEHIILLLILLPLLVTNHTYRPPETITLPPLNIPPSPYLTKHYTHTPSRLRLRTSEYKFP